MKLVDNVLSKIGIDKILHHVVGALICALISFVLIPQNEAFNWNIVTIPIVGSIVVLVISIIKECFDSKPDWMDVVWAMAGCLWVFAAISFGILFNQLSS